MSETTLKIRITFGARGVMGPGKADLLEGIADTGSIAAAGRRMGMSYKRAWSLIETMNAMFADPVVETSRGGAAGGGARLTDAGRAVLGTYRALQSTAAEALDPHVQAFEARLADMSDRK